MSDDLRPRPGMMIDGNECLNPEQAYGVFYRGKQVDFCFILSGTLNDQFAHCSVGRLGRTFQSQDSFVSTVSRQKKIHRLEPDMLDNQLVMESTYDTQTGEMDGKIRLHRRIFHLEAFRFNNSGIGGISRLPHGVKREAQKDIPTDQISAAYKFLNCDKEIRTYFFLNTLLSQRQNAVFDQYVQQENICVLKTFKTDDGNVIVKAVTPDDADAHEGRSHSTAPFSRPHAYANAVQLVRKLNNLEPFGKDDMNYLAKQINQSGIALKSPKS